MSRNMDRAVDLVKAELAKIGIEAEEWCAYLNCGRPAESCCDHCNAAFCSDHGTCGGDHQAQDVGAVAYPAQCWRHGGFNVDE